MSLPKYLKINKGKLNYMYVKTPPTDMQVMYPVS